MPLQPILAVQWARQQGSIDRKLEAEAAGALYVQGGHRAGKSTTLLKYIWDRSQDLRDGALMVYLMNSRVECTMLRDHFRESVCTEEEREKVQDRAGRRSRAVQGHLYIISVCEWLSSVLQTVCGNERLPMLNPALRGVVVMDERVTMTVEWNLCRGVLADAVTSAKATLLLVGLGTMTRQESTWAAMFTRHGITVDAVTVGGCGWTHDPNPN
jgi:hypothetical protein